MGGAIKKTVLPNGVRVITERIPHLRTVSVGIWVEVGARDEEDREAGITHFIEHMVFKGTKSRSYLDIAKEMDSLGGLYNAFTNREYLWLYTKVMDEHLPKATDVLADIFLNSTFPEGELKRERGVILQEIRMVEDSPEDHAQTIFQAQVFKDNPLGRPVFGYPETVLRFTRDKAIAFLSRNFTPDRIILSAAGKVDHEDLIQLLGGPLSGISRPPVGRPVRKPPDLKSSVKVHTKDTGQVIVLLGLRGPSYTDELRYHCSLLNVILGANSSSRLSVEIRERLGLAYAVGSHVSAHQDTGLLEIFAGVAPAEVEKTLSAIKREILKLKREPVSEAELYAAKEYIKGVMFLHAESTDHRMTRLAKNEMYLGRVVPFAEILKRLSAITAEELNSYAQTLFDPKSTTLFLYGPLDGDEGLSGFLDG